VKLAIIGCGFVADYYMTTLPNYPHLQVKGVFDRDRERQTRFAKHYHLGEYDSVSDLLSDGEVEIVLNLTNPNSHYKISKSCLEAGKHVYSEKPLSMNLDEARSLVNLAKEKSLILSGAPCSVLSECAQSMWKQLRENSIGTVRLVYAELDDGLVHRMRYHKWLSESGTPWPYKDEFEVGCTLEHAGYYVTWLVAFFGPVKQVTPFAACLIPDKETDVTLIDQGADFSVVCMEFDSGIVARLTCSIVAPHDHSLRIFGDDGILSTSECWNYANDVMIKRRTKLALWAEKYPFITWLFRLGPRKCPPVKKTDYRHRYKGTTQMDFARGVAEMAEAIQQNRACRLSADFCLHVNEIVLAIENPLQQGCAHKIISRFDAMAPMPWAL
jgi:predicted dehydrogenase